MNMKVYFSANGRIGRRDWWNAVIPLFLASVLVSIFLFGYRDDFLSVLRQILLLLFAVAYIPVSVKRLHDLNTSGLVLLLALIPYIGVVCLFIPLGFIKGTVGVNKYGDVPL